MNEKDMTTVYKAQRRLVELCHKVYASFQRLLDGLQVQARRGKKARVRYTAGEFM